MWLSVLPGLRELRTPFASGVLWLVFTWVLLAHDADGWLAQVTAGADQLSVLGVPVSGAALLAALSFTAYLVGAVWEGLSAFVGVLLYRVALGPTKVERDLRRPW